MNKATTVVAIICLAIAGWLMSVQLDKLPYDTIEDKVVHYIAWTAYIVFCIVCVALLSVPRKKRGNRR